MKFKTDKTIEKTAEIQSCFFEEINKINRALARLIREKKERRHELQISGMRKVISLKIL